MQISPVYSLRKWIKYDKIYSMSNYLEELLCLMKFSVVR